MDGLEPVRPSTPMVMVVFGALIPLLGALFVGGLAVSQDWGGVRSLMLTIVEGDPSEALGGNGGTTAAEAVLVEEAVDEGAEETVDGDASQGESVIRFVSKWSGTIKLRVRCKEESAKGVTEATLVRNAASRCSITAIRSDRSRLTGVVDVVTEGEWLCFEGGEEGCRQK